MIAPDEYEIYRELDDKLILYRGGFGPPEILSKGLSWTLAHDTAALYSDAEGSIVIKAKARKTDLLVFLGDHQECIVYPAKLTAVQLVASSRPT